MKPRPYHVQANAKAQEDFKKFPEQVAEIVAQTNSEDKRPILGV